MAAQQRYAVYAASGNFEMEGVPEPNVDEALANFDDELEAVPDLARHSAADREFFELLGVA